MAKTKTKKNDTAANLGFEAKLWAAADALRNNMDAEILWVQALPGAVALALVWWS